MCNRIGIGRNGDSKVKEAERESDCRENVRKERER